MTNPTSRAQLDIVPIFSYPRVLQYDVEMHPSGTWKGTDISTAPMNVSMFVAENGMPPLAMVICAEGETISENGVHKQRGWIDPDDSVSSILSKAVPSVSMSGRRYPVVGRKALACASWSLNKGASLRTVAH